MRKLTQEEFLAEAKETEKINLASVKKIEALENERRKRSNAGRRKEILGPAIRYVSMSLVEEIPEDGDEVCESLMNELLKAVEEDLSFEDILPEPKPPVDEKDITVGRNYIVFDNFDENPLEEFGLRGHAGKLTLSVIVSF